MADLLKLSQVVEGAEARTTIVQILQPYREKPSLRQFQPQTYLNTSTGTPILKMCIVAIGEQFECPYCGETDADDESISITKLTTAKAINGPRKLWFIPRKPSQKYRLSACDCKDAIYWCPFWQFYPEDCPDIFAHLCRKHIRRHYPNNLELSYPDGVAVEQALYGYRDMRLFPMTILMMRRYIEDELDLRGNLEACYQDNIHFQTIHDQACRYFNSFFEELEERIDESLATFGRLAFDAARVQIDEMLQMLNGQLYPEFLRNLGSLPGEYLPEERYQPCDEVGSEIISGSESGFTTDIETESSFIGESDIDSRFVSNH